MNQEDKDLKAKFTPSNHDLDSLDCLQKREQFAVSLRKKKKAEILATKRRKNYEAAGISLTPSVLIIDTHDKNQMDVDLHLPNFLKTAD